MRFSQVVYGREESPLCNDDKLMEVVQILLF